MILIGPHTLNRMWPRLQTEIQSSVYRIGINPCAREEIAGLGKERNHQWSPALDLWGWTLYPCRDQSLAEAALCS